jgi:hypothetical protein
MTEGGGIGTTEHSHGALCPLITRHSSLVTAVLIHGGAIRNRANLHRFNNLKFSNRR